MDNLGINVGQINTMLTNTNKEVKNLNEKMTDTTNELIDLKGKVNNLEADIMRGGHHEIIEAIE